MKSFLLVTTVLALVAMASAGQGVANTKKTKSVPCDICKFLVTEFEKILDMQTEDIVGAANELCDSLGGQLAEVCHSFVNDYIEQIIDGLINDNPPEQVCTDIFLCP